MCSVVIALTKWQEKMKENQKELTWTQPIFEFFTQPLKKNCPLLRAFHYWGLLLHKNSWSPNFCPLMRAFPLLRSALLRALTVFYNHVHERNPILCRNASKVHIFRQTFSEPNFCQRLLYLLSFTLPRRYSMMSQDGNADEIVVQAKESAPSMYL